MSQLTTNTTSLQAILDTVNALPEVGSGGGSVETCTVTVAGSFEIIHIVATILLDGEIVTTMPTARDDGFTSFTLENVVRGTSVFVTVRSIDYSPGWTVTGAERVFPDSGWIYPYEGLFKITAAAGETATISNYVND